MFKKIVMVGMVLMLAACGGGGGGGTAGTLTPTGTSVNLTPFKNVFLGTSAGTQYSFPTLSGTDSLGRAWSGSFTVIADGTTTFEAQNVTKRRSLVTLQLVGGTAVSSITTAYFQVADGAPYKSVTNTGITYTPTSQVPIPATAKVGDFGAFATLSGSDGTTTTSTWALNADYNGASILVLSSIIKTGATVTGTEADSFYLDATGIPTKISISATTSGVTVNLSGSKN